MKILMVGSGKGSWTVRGLQLGAAIGARVKMHPDHGDFAWADLVVFVKRVEARHIHQAQRLRKLIVWDALDFWDQPEHNALTESEALALLQAQIARIRPVLTIGATEAMATACGGAYLPHHSWQGLSPTPARDVVTTVVYEGKRKHLGRWGKAVQSECARRGWAFVINPPDLRAADIIVAFRDGQWDGWMCREWKSGVKIVNALAAGRPIIGQISAGMRELWPAGSVVETGAELTAAFDAWSDLTRRQAAVEQSIQRAPAYALASVAATYRRILSAQLERAA